MTTEEKLQVLEELESIDDGYALGFFTKRDLKKALNKIVKNWSKMIVIDDEYSNLTLANLKDTLGRGDVDYLATDLLENAQELFGVTIWED